MNSKLFSEKEMWALYACILEAKFSGSWRDYDVPMSPIVASIANRLADFLCSSGRFGDRASWQQWRTLTPERNEWASALRYVEFRDEWLDADDAAQAEHVLNLLSPFQLTEDMVKRFLVEAHDLRRQLHSSRSSRGE
jgi:hypothetical protein